MATLTISDSLKYANLQMAVEGFHATGPDASVMVLGNGIDPNGIKLRKGSLLLGLGDGDAVNIESWGPAKQMTTPNRQPIPLLYETESTSQPKWRMAA